MLRRDCIIPGHGMLDALTRPTPCQWSTDASEADHGGSEMALRLLCCRVAWTWSRMIETDDYSFPTPMLVGFTGLEEDAPALRRFDLGGLMPSLVGTIRPPAGPGTAAAGPRFDKVGIVFGMDGTEVVVSAIATRKFHHIAETRSVESALLGLR